MAWNAGGISTAVAPAAAAATAAGDSVFPGVGALAGGLLGGIGSLFSGYSAKQAARDQMDFQERMSSTAHQREVEDLKKAGLNPVLSAGGGASSPAGASWSMPNPLSDVGAGVASSAKMMAFDLPQLESQLRLQEAQRHLSLEQADKATADAAVSIAEASNVTADTDVKRMLKKKMETMLEPERAELVARVSEIGTRRRLMDAQRSLIPHSARALDSQSSLREADLPQHEFDSSNFGLILRGAKGVTSAAGDLISPFKLRFNAVTPPAYGGMSNANQLRRSGSTRFGEDYSDLDRK